MKEEEKILKLNGKTLAVIDWANVYGWTKKLKWQVDPQRLFDFLKSYPDIFDIRFYFGVEKGNEKSEKFQEEVVNIGYNSVSKEVKWVPVILEQSHFKDILKELKEAFQNWQEPHSASGASSITLLHIQELNKILNQPLRRRKCDFDVEITKDILTNVDNFDTLILFSGDGDYKAIVEYLLDNRKKAIVIHSFGLRGKEYNELLIREENRPYFCAVEKLTSYLK